MNILAFESSCDETAVAVVRDGRQVLSDAILSQADMHALYGGVVPEIASRKHVQAIAALSDKALADAVRAIANYGSDRRYHNIYQGLNCRMDELQAAVLSVKLQHLADISGARRRNAAVYDREIVNPLLRKPKKLPGNVWHQYVVLVADGRRDEFRKFLSDNGVPTDVHYAVPPHLQPCYAGLANSALPVAERIAAECVSIPIAEHLTETDISDISEIINVFR